MKKVFSVSLDYDFKIEAINDEINKNKEASKWFAQITDMIKAELKNSTLIEAEAFLNNEKAIKLLTINKPKNNVSNN
jgi:hypothetical protein